MIGCIACRYVLNTANSISKTVVLDHTSYSTSISSSEQSHMVEINSMASTPVGSSSPARNTYIGMDCSSYRRTTINYSRYERVVYKISVYGVCIS